MMLVSSSLRITLKINILYVTVSSEIPFMVHKIVPMYILMIVKKIIAIL